MSVSPSPPFVSQTADQQHPLAVLSQGQPRERPYEHALLMTFTVDLGFLESRLLGQLQSKGCRVTVVADANMWDPDVRATKFAGRRYHLGLVQSRMAFHPKLTLLVGPAKATAIIGSGNLTLAGWQYNHEIAAVLTGTDQEAPQALVDLFDALTSLRDIAPLDPATRSRIEGATRTLGRMLDQATVVDTGHRVRGSWQSPLIDLVPREQVDELLVSAPFHDGQSRALTTLIERTSPRSLSVALQERQTSCDASTLARALDHAASTIPGSSQSVVTAPGERYRHGKLIEWVVDEQRWALTGSPNLSRAALLSRDAGRSANYELALVGPLETSLFPPGTPVEVDNIEVALLESRPGEADTDAPTIIGAVNGTDGTTVYLASVTRDVHLESSMLLDAPEEWTVACSVTPGAESVTLDPALPGGSRLRLVWSDGRTTLASPPFFLTEPSQAFARPGGDGSRSRSWSSSPQDLLGHDLAALGWVVEELTALAHELATQAEAQALSAAPSAGAGGERANYVDSDIDPWLWSQPVVDRLGPRLAAYALALPRPATADEPDAPSWSDTALDEEAGGLDGETTEPVVESTVEMAAAEDMFVSYRYEAEERRAARRSLCTKLVDRADSLPIPYILFGLRLQLTFWRGETWDEGDLTPIQNIKVWLDRLAATEPRAEESVRARSLVAIALTMLRSLARTDAMDETTMLVRRVILDHRDSAVGFDEETVDLYLDGMVPGWDLDYWAGRVSDFVHRSVHDPLAAVEDQLRGAGADVSRPSPTSLHAVRDVRNVELAALSALRSIEPGRPVAVWVSNREGAWALALFRQPDVLLVSRKPPKRVRWRHFVLNSRVGVGALHDQLRSGSLNPRLERKTRPPFVATDKARELLGGMGIVDPEPPACDMR